jgi:hypothetical protein
MVRHGHRRGHEYFVHFRRAASCSSISVLAAGGGALPFTTAEAACNGAAVAASEVVAPFAPGIGIATPAVFFEA